ncbi:MAG: glycoside hydrolase family 88 protein, partial [Chloroflexi bacterium]|nr:glycoside hydrolase family 88 protein [Chloroflexota bacterium]
MPAGRLRRGGAELEAKHRAHVEALVARQHPSGAWHQVIDRPDSYLELTATAMIGYAITRGVARGWLPAALDAAAARAWSAVAERIDGQGMVRDACMGTGPLPTLEDYLTRGAVSGHDDRAGTM